MKYTITTATALVLASAVSAQAVLVDFSTNFGAPLSNGDLLNGGFDFGGGLTGTLTAVSDSDEARILDTEIAQPTDDDLTSPFTAAGDSDVDNGAVFFGNSLILQNNFDPFPPSNDDPDGGTFSFAFDAVLDFEQITLLDIGDQGASASVFIDGGLVTTRSDAGDNEYTVIDLTGFSGSLLAVTLTGSGAIGEFAGTPQGGPTEVPLPAPVLLLMSGIAGLGLLRLRSAKA